MKGLFDTREKHSKRSPAETAKPITLGTLRLVRFYAIVTGISMLLVSVSIGLGAYSIIDRRFQQVATSKEMRDFRGVVAIPLFVMMPLGALMIFWLAGFLGRPVQPESAAEPQRTER